MKPLKTKVHKHLPSNRWAIFQRGQVVGYADTCTLENVTTHMNPNIKAKNAHKRSVHCWTLGQLVGMTGFTPLKGRTVELSASSHECVVSRVVRYNPFRDEYLNYTATGDEYTGSDVAVFEENGLMTV